MTLGYAVTGLAVIGGLWFWQRARYRAACEKLAGHIESLRRLSLRQVRYVPVGAGDSPDPATQQVFVAATSELEPLGCRVLADLVEQTEDGSASGVVRWFRGGDGTACGWVGLARQTPVMMLFSESAAGDYFVTRRGGADRAVARPPNLLLAAVRWEQGVAALLERHRALVGERAADLRRIDRADDAVALLGRLRANNARWRADQPAGALLEADLRSMLLDHYDEFAPGIRRALAARSSAV